MARVCILVSACLLGLNTKYDGKNNYNEEIAKLVNKSDLLIIPFCPEQLGGLPTPREPADLTSDGNEILNRRGKVLTWKGDDVTEEFIRGAYESLKLAKLYNAKIAILKARSPSCGVNGVYRVKDHKLMNWDGVTAALFKSNGIRVISDEDFIKRGLNL